MHIAVEAVNLGAIQALVVIPADENFVKVGQVAEPVEKIKSLGLTPGHGEIARMNCNIGGREVEQPPMAAVGVGDVEEFHDCVRCNIFPEDSQAICQD